MRPAICSRTCTRAIRLVHAPPLPFDRPPRPSPLPVSPYPLPPPLFRMKTLNEVAPTLLLFPPANDPSSPVGVMSLPPPPSSLHHTTVCRLSPSTPSSVLILQAPPLPPFPSSLPLPIPEPRRSNPPLPPVPPTVRLTTLCQCLRPTPLTNPIPVCPTSSPRSPTTVALSPPPPRQHGIAVRPDRRSHPPLMRPPSTTTAIIVGTLFSLSLSPPLLSSSIVAYYTRAQRHHRPASLTPIVRRLYRPPLTAPPSLQTNPRSLLPADSTLHFACGRCCRILRPLTIALSPQHLPDRTTGCHPPSHPRPYRSMSFAIVRRCSLPSSHLSPPPQQQPHDGLLSPVWQPLSVDPQLPRRFHTPAIPNLLAL